MNNGGLSFKTPSRSKLPPNYRTFKSIYDETLVEPKNDGKFLGAVTKESSGKWKVKIVVSSKSRDARAEINFSEHVNDYDEAISIWKNTCMYYGLVRNKMVDKGTHIEMSLTDRATTIIDRNDVSVADKHNWLVVLSNGHSYARAYITHRDGSKNVISLHNLILGYELNDSELTVDHIDRNPMNNLRRNLRISDKSEQAFNRDTKPGSSGITGISEGKKKGSGGKYWQARVRGKKFGQKRKYFFWNTHGGPDKALEKAKEWLQQTRDELEIDKIEN